MSKQHKTVWLKWKFYLLDNQKHKGIKESCGHFFFVLLLLNNYMIFFPFLTSNWLDVGSRTGTGMFNIPQML